VLQLSLQQVWAPVMSTGYLSPRQTPSGGHPRRPVLFLSRLMNRVSSRVRNVVVFVAAACSGLLFFLEDWQRDLSTNYARLDEAAKNPLLRPQVLALKPTDAAKVTKQWVTSNRMWEVQSEAKEDGTVKLHLTRTTRVLRFIDDIHVEFQLHPSGVIVQAISQSRVGKGDLGQNPRNLLELTEALIRSQKE